MKDKNLKIGLAVAGIFSSILAIRESRKMKKTMEETSEQRQKKAEEQFEQVKEKILDQSRRKK